jgi:hypothetical protein
LTDYSGPEMVMKATERALAELCNIGDCSLDCVSDEIRAFSATPIADLTEKQIVRTVDRLLDVYALLPLTLSKKGFDVWRVRESSEGELFSAFSDAGPPPPECAGAGRANSGGTSVFYCGSSPETCFAESRLSEGNFFHLYRYELIEGEQLSLVMIGDLDSIRRTGHSIMRSPIVERGYSNILSSLSGRVRLAMQLVDAFLFDQIGRKGDPYQYRVTQIIFDAVSSGLGVDGVMYPSVEHAGGFNYALKTHAYQNKVSVSEANAQLVKKSYGYGAYRCCRFGPAELNHDKAQIIWPDVPGWVEVLKGLASIDVE